MLIKAFIICWEILKTYGSRHWRLETFESIILDSESRYTLQNISIYFPQNVPRKKYIALINNLEGLGFLKCSFLISHLTYL